MEWAKITSAVAIRSSLDPQWYSGDDMSIVRFAFDAVRCHRALITAEDEVDIGVMPIEFVPHLFRRVSIHNVSGVSDEYDILTLPVLQDLAGSLADRGRMKSNPHRMD